MSETWGMREGAQSSVRSTGLKKFLQKTGFTLRGGYENLKYRHKQTRERVKYLFKKIKYRREFW